MCPLRCFLVALTAIALLIVSEGRASAKERARFDLHGQTANAEWIVLGRLDAKGLTVDATLKGKATLKHLLPSNGVEVFFALNEVEKQVGSVEVVAYLRKTNGRWEITHRERSVVGFFGNGVCLVHGEGGRGFEDDVSKLARHPTLLREEFLKRARAAVAAIERKKVLLALPPSADRMSKIVAFLLNLEREGRYYHMWYMSRALLPLAPVEEKELASFLKTCDAAFGPDLLRLAGSTARGEVAFDAVAGLLDPERPSAVRYAAISALASIDPYRAQERLIPLLRADEPMLRSVFHVLRGSDPFRLNPAVVEPLRKLTEAVRRRHRFDREALAQESYDLADVLGHLGHPKLLPGLVEWVQSDDHVSAEKATEVLRALTGMSPREDAHEWERWWKKAKPLLEAKYDLRRARDRREWYRAYRSGGAEGRALLLRLWAFEPALDERAMVREAGGEGGDVAKIALAALWTGGRLSSATKGDLVEKFLSVRLEERSDLSITDNRHLRIVGERRFPFPPGAWVHSRMSIVIGDGREATLDGSSGGTSSLGEGAKIQTLGSMSGGSYHGTPQARAILELRAVESDAAGKAVWKREWKLGPLRLQQSN